MFQINHSKVYLFSLFSLLESSSTNYTFLKSFNSKFQTNEAWIKDQNCQPLEIEDRINLTLVLKQNIHYTTRYSIEPRDSMYVKGHGFFLLKTWVKIQAINIVKNFDRVKKNLQQKQ